MDIFLAIDSSATEVLWFSKDQWIQVSVSLFTAVAAIVAGVATFYAVRYTKRQTMIFENQTKILRDQTKVFEEQNSIFEKQTELSFKQTGIIDRQLRLGLYEKQIAAYQDLQNHLGKSDLVAFVEKEVNMANAEGRTWCVEFGRIQHRASFLFAKDIDLFIEELKVKAFKLRQNAIRQNQLKSNSHQNAGEMEKAINEEDELFIFFSNAGKNTYDAFSKYLRLYGENELANEFKAYEDPGPIVVSETKD